MNGSSITWLDGTAPAGAPCPICGSVEGTGLLLVHSVHPHPRELQLNKCQQCGSAFYEGENIVRGYEGNEGSELAWRHYVEIGAGINSLLGFALCAGPPANASLLDIGCGFGFVVDYWRRVRGCPAVGLESAYYGRVGRTILGAEIHHQYLSECTAIAGRSFDVVLSAEVIEHVPDPGAFLADLRTALTADGVLVLTSPSSGGLRSGADIPMLLAALSPGLHYFLLSRQALEKLLSDAGFTHIEVVDSGGRLTAVASRRAVRTPDFGNLHAADYHAYLAALAELDDKSVRGGALYRLFKEEINAGHFTQAAAHYESLNALAREHYGLNLSEPRIEAVLAYRDWVTYGDEFPFWYGPSLYYIAHLVLRESGPEKAEKLFGAAVRMLRHEVENWPEIAQEASSLLTAAEDNHYKLASRSRSVRGDSVHQPVPQRPAGWLVRHARGRVRRGLKGLHGALWKIGIRIPRP